MHQVNLNAAMQTDEDIARLRVARQPQDDDIRRGLGAGCNVLLYGSRGSGKTFTLKALAQDLGAKGSAYTPVAINGWRAWASGGAGFSDFPSYLLLALAKALWEVTFPETYFKLLQLTALDKTRVLDSLKPRQRRFADIYQALQARQFDVRSAVKTTAGATMVAKSEIGTERSSGVTRGALLPFEAQAMLDELLSISGAKAKTPVILCDEIELLLPDGTPDLTSSYLEIFNAAGVRFVCTAPPHFDSGMRAVPEAFELALSLEGMETVEAIQALVARHFDPSGASFEDDAIDVVKEFFGGHVRKTLMACDKARGSRFDVRTEAVVRADMMVKACLALQRQENETLQAIAARRP